MRILGHSAGTALMTLLLGFCAMACLFSGVWGLLGRSVWIPNTSPLKGSLILNPEGATATGRYARLAGAALLLAGIMCIETAAHVWRTNAF